jgi:hypothetical protein
MVSIWVEDDLTAGSMRERRQVLLLELIARFDVAKKEEFPIDHFKAMNCFVSVTVSLIILLGALLNLLIGVAILLLLVTFFI